jgi:hypothetical protein
VNFGAKSGDFSSNLQMGAWALNQSWVKKHF